MNRSRRLRGLFWALAALAAMHLGPQCGSAPPPGAASQVRFDIVSVANIAGGAYIAWADVLVETEEEFQSWEMTLTWDSPSLVSTGASAHVDFDDDGQLAVTAASGSGSAGPFADLRHGTPAAGLTRVATVFFQSTTGDLATISVTGRLARPDGTLIPMVESDAITVP